MRPGNRPDSSPSFTRRIAIVALAAGALGTATLATTALAVTEVRITHQAQASSAPAVAYGAQGRVSIAWSDTRDGNSEIYYCALDAWGNRLTPDVRITNTAAASVAPRLGVDAEGNVYLVWREANNAYVAKATWQGDALVQPKAVSLGSYVVFMNPDISVVSGGGCAVGVGARVNANYDLWVIRFDAGLNQGCKTNALFINATASNGPRVSIETSPTFSSNLTFWRESIDPFDYGNSLSTIVATSGCGRGSRTDHCGGNSFPTIDSHGHGVVFERSNKVWLTSGSGCGQQLSENPGPSVSPAAAALSSARSIAVWSDRRSGDSDLYYATYTSAFVKEGADVALVTGGSNATFPAVAADAAGNAFVAWQDDRDGNAEIYMARTPEPEGFGTIVGTVINGVTGEPMPFAFVDVTDPDHSEIVTRRFVAGADGRYRVAGLSPSGPWALLAGRDGFTSPQVFGVEVPAGQTVTVDLRVSTGTVLSGTIRDAFNGLPIRGAEVRADSAGGLPARSLVTGPDGRYRFDVYPGTYDVSVEVPSAGAEGPYLSLSNPYYEPATRTGIVVGSEPHEEPVGLAGNTVVLVHGIFNRAEDWGTVEAGTPPSFRRALEEAGWHTEAITYDWKRSIEEGGVALQRWIEPHSFRSSRVVAHSMGGLVSRWYAEEIAGAAGELPFSHLVTLGTLHHGTPLAHHLKEMVKSFFGWLAAKSSIPGIDDLTELAIEAAIRNWLPFAIDFEPGSARLAQLNYGPDAPEGTDGPRLCVPWEPAPTHAPEQLQDGVRYVTFAGDHPQDPHLVAGALLMDGCPSDGAVPVHSARLYDTSPQVSNYRVSCFGTDEQCQVQHEPRFSLRARGAAGPFAIDLRNSTCVRPRVLDALQGVTDPCEPADALLDGVAAAETVVVPLPAFEHLLAPGDSAADVVEVPAGSRFVVLANGRQDGIVLELESPSGARIDSAACAGVAGRLHESDPSQVWAYMEISGAEGGAWIVRTRSLADSAQRVSARPFLPDEVTLAVLASPDQVAPGEPVVITAMLERTGTPLLEAAVACRIADPAGSVGLLDLRDDGVPPDLVPADGLYAGAFAPDTSGTFAVEVTATGGVGPAHAPRSAATGFTAAPGLDIALPASGIATPRLWTYPGDVLPITFSVGNAGPLDADSVWIHVRDDSAGVTVLDSIVSIAAAGAVEFTAPWRATQTGLHGLRFAARALGPVADLNRANSVAWRGFEIVPFGSSPSIVTAPALPAPRARTAGFPSRVIPNPSRGTAVIEFELPRATEEVTLTIVDVAGRRVASVRLGRLDAGLHRVPWRTAARASSWSSSVLYYRIQAGADAATGRIVTVR